MTLLLSVQTSILQHSMTAAPNRNTSNTLILIFLLTSCTYLYHFRNMSSPIHLNIACWNMRGCTTVACLPPIRGLEKCRVIGHNPHFSNLCSLSCLNPKVLPKGILFSACDWWKAVNCGTSHIDSSEAVVYGIPLGLLGFAS